MNYKVKLTSNLYFGYKLLMLLLIWWVGLSPEIQAGNQKEHKTGKLQNTELEGVQNNIQNYRVSKTKYRTAECPKQYTELQSVQNKIQNYRVSKTKYRTIQLFNIFLLDTLDIYPFQPFYHNS